MKRGFICILLVILATASLSEAGPFKKKPVIQENPKIPTASNTLQAPNPLADVIPSEEIEPEGEETIRLFSDHIGYEQSNRIVVVSSNVHLEYKNIQISGDKLTMDVDNNLVWGTGKIHIKRGEDEFDSNGIMLDLDNEIVTLNSINICILPPKEQNTPQGPTDKLYVRARILTDTPTHKYGFDGILSACSYTPGRQHNYVWAKSFKYYPDKKLVMYNVVFYNKFLFVPVYFWLPYYRYELGPRKIVWNFPTIGKKDEPGWGWFVQNTIDYRRENGKDSSVLVDWFEANDGRRGNWGYGIRHYYELKKNAGRLYYYNYDFSQQTAFGPINQSNSIKDWTNVYTFNDKWSLSHYITDINVDRKINSTGKEIRNNKGFALRYDDLGDTFDTTYDASDNDITHVRSTRYGFQRSFNNRNLYRYNYSETDIISSFRQDISSSGEYTWYLPSDTTVRSEFTYTAFESNWKDTTPADTSLITKLSLTKKVTDHLDFGLVIDQQMDIDSSKVTTDALGGNNYLHRLPELKFSFKNLTYKKLQFTQTTTIAKYREIHFDNSSEKNRDYPEQLTSIEPNTYIFNQRMSTSIDNLPLKSTWTMSTGYDQYIFKTANKNLFEGDALYLFSFNTGLNNSMLGFIRTNTSYTSRYAPKENNSPFFQFQQSTSQENMIAESITFYYEKEKLRYFPYYFGLTWDHSTDYSFVRQQQNWGLYNTRATLKLTKLFTMSVDTAKKLNFTESQKSTRFNPFHITMDLVPTENWQLHYDLSLDLNKWIDNDVTDIRNSNITFGFLLGKNPDYEWHVQTGFVYQKQYYNEEHFIVDRYQLQTLNLVKKEHERELIIGYNKQNDELRVLYRFNVFPNDPLELVKRKNVWTVEGRLKQGSEERFKGGS